MPREESLYPADWLRIAEKDLGRVKHLLHAHDAEAAGFYLQQAVEKFLPFITEVSVTQEDVRGSLKQVEGLIENLRTGTAR